MATTAEIFAQIQGRMAANPQKLASINAVYHFSLSGEDGGSFHVTLSGGQGTAGAGAPQTPDCTVLMSSADFKAMVAGTANATGLFMSGKLRIQGDMGLAMRLQSLLG